MALALGALALLAPQAHAQTASQLTPEDARPETQPLRGAIVFSGQTGLAPPPGAEALTISLGGVVVEGTLPGMEVPTEALRQRLTGGRIRASELFEAASELEQAYANEGYVLARVVLPAQRLTDGGTLRLQVIDGFVERIDDSAVPAEVRGRLRTLTEPLVGRRGLRLAEIERRILLAGDTYGVALGSALQAGASPGGTVIVLDPEYQGITGFVGFDNSLSEQLGTWKVDTGVEFNGLLGFGEAIYARLSGHPGEGLVDDPLLRTFTFGAVVPVGREGATVNVEAARSVTNVDDAGSDLPSEFERVSVRLFYPWVRSRTFNLTTQLAFDIQEDRLDIDADGGRLPVYEDSTRVIRFAGDAFWLTERNATIELGAELSFGLDCCGARSADDVGGGTPLSRDGADSDFAKLVLSGRYRTPLGEATTLTVNGRAQSSFGDPLVVAEQFGLASPREISPLDAGSLLGDSGWVLRGEVARQFETEAGGTPLSISPYVFAATGAAYLHEPAADEQDETYASAFGLGVDLFSPFDEAFSNASVRLELGRGTRNDDEDDVTSVGLSTSFRF